MRVTPRACYRGRVEERAGPVVEMKGAKLAVILMCAVAMAALVVLTQALVAGKPARAATDRLPDLGMARLTNIQIRNTNDGRQLLRFDTRIVNTGAGKFEVHGSRPDTSTPTMSVAQRIFDDAGGHRDVPTTAQMYYAGDGHNHWHVRNLESYTLIRLDNGVKVGRGAKEGFCFFDNYRYGSARDPYYTAAGGACGYGAPSALRVKMGLSVGWGDIYSWQTVGQYIDVTNLTSGRYRLWATADKANWFEESNNTNNFTWANVQIQSGQVRVLKYGPSAQPI